MIENMTETTIPEILQIIPNVIFLSPFCLICFAFIDFTSPNTNPTIPRTNPTLTKDVIIDRIPRINVILPLPLFLILTLSEI